MERFERNKCHENIGNLDIGKGEPKVSTETLSIMLRGLLGVRDDLLKEKDTTTETHIPVPSGKSLHDWSYGVVDVIGLDIDKDKKEYKPLKLDNSHIIKDNKPYYTCDGKRVSTMEAVIEYNNRYYENLKEGKKLIR